MKPATLIQQLEIGIEAVIVRRRRPAIPCRPARARWWFDQMRRVVEQAADRSSGRPFPPEQISLPLGRGR
jgi:hypothetical protein